MDVEPLYGIKPRMFAVEFERPAGNLAFSVIVPATDHLPTLEKVHTMFPEFRRTSRQGRVHEVAHVEIDWDIGRTFVIKRRRWPPKLMLNTGDARKGSMAGKLEGGQPG